MKASENSDGSEKLTSTISDAISDVIINLNISRKNFLIYPQGHLQVNQSIDRAYEKLKLLLLKKREVILGVANDQLFVANESIDEKNIIFKELATSLKNIDIACVTFFQHLEKDDLSKFLSLLVKNGETINEMGGISRVVEKENFKTIKITASDYSKLFLTEEDEIKKIGKQEPESRRSFGWKSFVDNLISGTLSNADGSVSIADLDEAEGARLAEYLNSSKIDIKSVMDNYENLINAHLSIESPDSSKSDRPFNMAGLNTLLSDLNPSIRKQFLSSTFEQCSKKSSERVNPFLDTLPKKIVIEMLGEANQAGREISPSLMGLIQKLAATQDENSKNFKTDDLNGSDIFSKFKSDEIKNLFKRENYENYVTGDYSEMLTSMSAKSKQTNLKKIEGFSIDDYMETLEESHIDFQIAQIIVAFMDLKSTTKDEYTDYIDKLFSIIDTFDFDDKKYFHFLINLLKTIVRHSKTKKSEEIGKLAKESLQKFNEPILVSKLLKSFDKMGTSSDPGAFELLKSIGSLVIQDLINIYGKKEEHEEKRHLLNLLIALGENSAIEATASLSDSRPNWVKNMITVIRELNYKESEPKLKPLMESSDDGVRMEAISALLKFDNSWARIALKKNLHSDNEILVSKAVSFAGIYKVKEVVPDLITMIKPNSLFAADYEQNEVILKTLGDIGDIEAIPALKKLSKIFFSVRPTYLARMKLALFESLKGYPYQSVASLVREGRESSDEAIQKICKGITMAQKREK